LIHLRTIACATHAAFGPAGAAVRPLPNTSLSGLGTISTTTITTTPFGAGMD
jgi:hypothetical protein